MNERHESESQETAGDERGDPLTGLDEARTDPRIDDEIGIPATQSSGGLAGDAESGGP